MLVVKLPSAEERKRIGDSQAIRDTVASELSESERGTVVYLGNGLIGFADAPTLPDQAASQAFDALAQSFADRLGIDKSLIDVLSQSEVEDYLLERYNGDQNKVDAMMAQWYEQS